MPRILDADDRERTVISAAWRLIAREGVGALSVRNVAAEAGLAPSSLRYTFPTQAAVRVKSIEAIPRRLLERVSSLPQDADPDSRGRLMLLELLPLDEARRLEMSVFLAMGMAAVTDSELQPLWHQADSVVRGVCADALRLCGRSVSVETTDHLHALIDGLALHALLAKEYAAAGRPERVIDAFLRSQS